MIPSPNAVPTGGTAAPRPEDDYAGNPNLPLSAQYTHQLRTDPSFRPPKGYHTILGPDQQTMVIPDAGFLDKHGLQLILSLAAVSTGIGAAAGMGPFAAGAGEAATGASAGSTIGSGEAGSMAGQSSSLLGLGGSAGGGGGGGILGKIFGFAKNLSPILGGASAANQNQLNLDNLAQAQRDRTNLDSAHDQDQSILQRAGVDLQRRDFALNAPGHRLSTGVRGSAVANAHNIGVGTGPAMTLSSGRTINPIQYTGGGPDDLLSPDARSLGSMVTKDMLAQETAGDHFDPLDTVEYPRASAPKQGSVLDRILGAGALGAGVVGAVGSAFRRKPVTGLDPNVTGMNQ